MRILIKEVRLRNFRSLENVNVELDKVTILVGANNMGKTTFLKALELVLGKEKSYVKKEDIFISPNEGYDIERNAYIDVLIIPTNENGERENSFAIEWQEHFGQLIRIDENDKESLPLRTIIKYDKSKGEYITSRWVLENWEKDPDRWIDTEIFGELQENKLENIPMLFLDAQRDIVREIKDSKSYWGLLTSNAGIPSEVTSEIEEELEKINQKVISKSEILLHFQTILGKLNDINIGPDNGVQLTPITKKLRDLYRGIDVQFKDSESESFPLEFHGMGTRSWATLLTFHSYVSWLDKINRENNRPFSCILALEEPESHLHPQAQRQILQQIQKFEGQRIVSTHSPYIVALSDLSSIRHFSKNGSATNVSKIKVDNLNGGDMEKIKREVMNTRGELLFSRAIVLFEGPTEELAFPMFFYEYFGKHPYELGINFVGVGGKGARYTPFINVAKGLVINWYIFSDGEQDVIRELDSALQNVQCSINDNNVFVIEDGKNFEGYLLGDYAVEIEELIKEMKLENIQNEEYAARIRSNEYSFEDMQKELKKSKTKYGPLLASKITAIENTSRRIPQKIRNLFEQIERDLGIRRRDGV
ncbi:ATP-dependent nuclease [Bacillus nitratireducens]|uniref:ATP-dependent nuclease n=1 Tax=Bacillus nitratireducens TaxID=2026193 RepID=UPI0033964605